MKIISTLILFTLLMDNTLKAQVFKTADDSLAYSLGVLIAENLRQQGFADLNPELVAMGLKTSMKGEPSLIPLEECGKNVQASATKKQMMQNAPIKEAGEKFLGPCLLILVLRSSTRTQCDPFCRAIAWPAARDGANQPASWKSLDPSF